MKEAFMPQMFLLPGGTGKRAIVWTVLFFLVAQMGLSIYLNRQRPELRDPAFGFRLQTLQQRLKDDPDSLLVLVLGSSRAMNGLAPLHMPIQLDRNGNKLLIYNFALPGSGSIRELMTLRRLRAAGIKPNCVLIETWPVLWSEDGAFAERPLVAADELRWSDWTVLSHALPGKLELFARTLKGNLIPLVSYRSRLLHAGARGLLPHEMDRGLTREDADWTCADGTGWLPYRKLPADADALRREVQKGLLVAAPLLHPLRISPDYDRALNDLLDDCRDSGIKTALFLMPEHSECRHWYTPQTHVIVRAYLRQLSEKYACPILDARDWATDDSFADFCHLAPWGVPSFSRRFAEEALRPWLLGEPLKDSALLADDKAARVK
jgi:hypothetical protein